MAITVTLDTVESAGLEGSLVAGQPTRFIRPGFIENLDLGGTNKSEALWRGMEAAVIADAAAPVEAARNVVLQKIILDPVSDFQAKLRLVYETLIFNLAGPPSTYILRDSGYMRSMETSYIPGTRIPLDCTWVGSPGSGSASGVGFGTLSTAQKITDRVVATIMAPMRTVVVSALIYGSVQGTPNPLIYGNTPPDTGGRDHICYANDAAWPTDDSAGIDSHLVGFWRLDKYETMQSRYAGYYSIEAQATTKIIEPWDDFLTLRNTQTGRYVKLDIAELTSALALPYSYGIIHNGNGFIRAGWYPLANFATIFGF